jgi:NAD(P)-dependent dehydrogenase (short-subunit alcohol dehydrogenase family)
VINVGSIDGIRAPFVDNFAYGPAKAAVHHLTRVLAIRIGERMVTVNAIAPGPFESKMTEWLLDQFQDRIEENCPLGRIGVPGDMAGVAIYLSSRAGAYVNGVVIPVDGGICIK